MDGHVLGPLLNEIVVVVVVVAHVDDAVVVVVVVVVVAAVAHPGRPLRFVKGRPSRGCSLRDCRCCCCPCG